MNNQAAIELLRTVQTHSKYMQSDPITRDSIDRIIERLKEANKECYDEGLNNEEKGLVHLGRKVGAIKSFRERTGYGLRACKDVVDAYQESVQWVIPS